MHGKRRLTWATTLLLVSTLVFSACAQTAQPFSQPSSVPAPAADARYGGTIKVALAEDLAGADAHSLAVLGIAYVLGNVWEGLFGRSADYRPVPVLAESGDMAPDGKQLTVKLRQGVKFHDGSEFTASDAKTSMERFGKRSSLAQADWQFVESVVAADDYTLIFKFKEPHAAFLDILASPLAVVMPHEVALDHMEEVLPADKVVGTGPYKLAEFKPGERYRVVRFDGYVSREDDPNGWGGKRHAYADEIVYTPISEEASRLAAVMAGDVHYAWNLPVAHYEALKADAVAEPIIAKPGWWAWIIFNFHKQPFQNRLVRQAVATGIDNENILRSITDNNPAFYELDHGLLMKGTAFANTTGSDRYNQKDVSKAKEMLKEAGYQGQELVILTSPERPRMYKSAIALKSELEKLGIPARLDVMDWTSALKARNDLTRWDIFISANSLQTDPVAFKGILHSGSGFALKYGHPKMDELFDQVTSEPDPKRRYEIWGQMQDLFYDEVPYLKPGNDFSLMAKSRLLEGFQYHNETFFWNSWLKPN